MRPARAALLTAAVALGIGVVLAVSGLPLDLVVLFMAVVAAGGALATAFVDPDEPTLPERSTSVRGGARREVGSVAWSLRGTRGRVSPLASLRLRTVAARRLARLGIDLDDPADRVRAEAALGHRAYRIISEPASRGYASLRSALRAVDRLNAAEPPGAADRLGDPTAVPTATTPRSPG